MSTIIYRRAKHAAHYGNGDGHDLEQWDVSDIGRADDGTPLRPEGVPQDAYYHAGYETADGEQRWLFVRPAALSHHPECLTCLLYAVRKLAKEVA